MSPLLLALWLAPGLAASESPRVAGGVVRSREWKVRRAPEKEEEFSGDVSYRGSETLIRADWALYRHASESWRARGKVRIERKLASGDLVAAEGEEALYDQKSRKGSLWGPGRVSFKRSPPEGDPDLGEAGRVDWTGREKVVLTGEVRLWGPRLEAWAERAEYDRTAGSLALSGGRPVLRKLEGWGPAGEDWTGAVKAEGITATESPRRLSADGKAAGWLRFPPSRLQEAGK